MSISIPRFTAQTVTVAWASPAKVTRQDQVPPRVQGAKHVAALRCPPSVLAGAAGAEEQPEQACRRLPDHPCHSEARPAPSRLWLSMFPGGTCHLFSVRSPAARPSAALTLWLPTHPGAGLLGPGHTQVWFLRARPSLCGATLLKPGCLRFLAPHLASRSQVRERGALGSTHCPGAPTREPSNPGMGRGLWGPEALASEIAPVPSAGPPSLPG